MQTIRNIYYVFLENVAYYSILILMFLAIVSMVLAIAFIIRERQNNAQKRLGKLVGKEGASKSGAEAPRFLGK